MRGSFLSTCVVVVVLELDVEELDVDELDEDELADEVLDDEVLCPAASSRGMVAVRPTAMPRAATTTIRRVRGRKLIMAACHDPGTSTYQRRSPSRRRPTLGARPSAG